MSARKVFSESEKCCLKKLIYKYKLNILPPTAQCERRSAWSKLTEEYNSIATNSKRTVQQLRKLYENLKTRGKHQLLVTEILSTLHAPGTESQESSPNQAPVNQGSELLASDSDKLCAVPVILGNPSIACGSVAALCRTTLKRAFLRNITIKMTRKAFSLRKRGYDIRRQREQQLHNLRVSTQKWLGKATEEKLKKIKLDRVLARLNGSAMLE